MRTLMGTRVTDLTGPDREGWCDATYHFEDGSERRVCHLADLRADSERDRELLEMMAAELNHIQGMKR